MIRLWCSEGALVNRADRRVALRLIALLAAVYLALAMAARPGVSSPRLSAGPLAWLLSASRNLGPAHREDISLAASLHRSVRPDTLIGWTRRRHLNVHWQVSSAWDSTHRLTPDVAADADPYSGVSILVDGRWMAGGGTSQWAPIWAGLTVLVDQFLSANGGAPVGNINPVLYRVAAGAARPAFHDVVMGGNAVRIAVPGYDLVPAGARLTPTISRMIFSTSSEGLGNDYE